MTIQLEKCETMGYCFVARQGKIFAHADTFANAINGLLKRLNFNQ
jgi:hypothetical protein